MDKYEDYFNDLAKRFWSEFSIPVQESDLSVNFANPSDVVRSLIKSRNWMGTLSENIIRLDQTLHKEQRKYNRLEHMLKDKIVLVLSRSFPIPGAAIKNKETQDAFIINNCSDEEKTILGDLRSENRHLIATIEELRQMKNSFEIMKKSLEKTTDWLIQYLNWHKFEIREKV